MLGKGGGEEGAGCSAAGGTFSFCFLCAHKMIYPNMFSSSLRSMTINR